MNVNQLAIAAGADLKWLLNASAILGKPATPTRESARWWGLVRVLESTFGMTLAKAAAGANRAFAKQNGDAEVVIAEDDASAASMSVNLFRYDSTALANLSRARVRELPKRRGRRPEEKRGNAVLRAAQYGLDVNLMKASLMRKPAERLAILDRNVSFVREMRRSGGSR